MGLQGSGARRRGAGPGSASRMAPVPASLAPAVLRAGTYTGAWESIGPDLRCGYRWYLRCELV